MHARRIHRKISGDEIKFNRKVGEVASEDFVAKRAK